MRIDTSSRQNFTSLTSQANRVIKNCATLTLKDFPGNTALLDELCVVRNAIQKATPEVDIKSLMDLKNSTVFTIGDTPVVGSSFHATDPKGTLTALKKVLEELYQQAKKGATG